MPSSAAPRGPVLLRPGSSPRRRLRRRIFLGLFALVFLGLLWPLHVPAARIFPLVLGLPFSFFWVVLLLAIQFAALLWLFLGEEPDPVGAEDPGVAAPAPRPGTDPGNGREA